MSLLDLLKPNIDSFGYITEKNGDGGDTFHREGAVLLAVHLLHHLKFIKVQEYADLNMRAAALLPALISPDGLIRRHVDQTKWYGNWDRGSRDQMHGLIGIGLHFDLLAKRVYENHKRSCCLLAQNWVPNTSDHKRKKLPDFTGPGFWSIWIRLGFLWAPNFVLALFDLSLLFNALIWRFFRSRDANDSDVWNVMQCLLLAHIKRPTAISATAAKIFAKMRKIDYTSTINPIQQRLNHYTRGDGVSGLAKIYEPIVEKIFYVHG